MKVFTENASTNFVDKNNVFVGYETGNQNCCEQTYFVINNKPSLSEFDSIDSEEELEPYVFNVDYVESLVNIGDYDDNYKVFELVAEGKPNLYLTLVNHHNGYYSHGFEVKINGKIVESGSL